MSNRANEYPCRMFCPLVDRVIPVSDCIENQDCATGVIRPNAIPKEYRSKENWSEICRQCKYFELD